MNILLLIVIMLIAMDQYAFSHILHRPLVACSLIGLALGDVSTGVLVGGTLELFTVYHQMSGRMQQNDGSVFASILATIAAIAGKLDTNTALSLAVGAWYLGIACNHGLDLLNLSFLSLARKAAETRNEKKLAVYQIGALVLRAIVYGVCGMLLAAHVSSLESVLSSLSENANWILIGLAAAGNCMPFVGLAVLLRNIDLKNLTGALWAGIAFGAISSSVLTGNTSLVLAGITAFAIAAYDYHNQPKEKNTVPVNQPAAQTTNAGGGEKWW